MIRSRPETVSDAVGNPARKDLFPWCVRNPYHAQGDLQALSNLIGTGKFSAISHSTRYPSRMPSARVPIAPYLCQRGK